MAGLPIMNEHLRLFRLIAQRTRQATMIFVSVSEDDATNIGNVQSVLSQSGTQSIDRVACFWARIDQRNRILFDEIDVDRADVEGSWKRNGNDAHQISNLRFEIL